MTTRWKLRQKSNHVLVPKYLILVLMSSADKFEIQYSSQYTAAHAIFIERKQKKQVKQAQKTTPEPKQMSKKRYLQS